MVCTLIQFILYSYREGRKNDLATRLRRRDDAGPQLSGMKQTEKEKTQTMPRCSYMTNSVLKGLLDFNISVISVDL